MLVIVARCPSVIGWKCTSNKMSCGPANASIKS